jgi:perosamine synthetase
MKPRRTVPPVGYRIPFRELAGAVVPGLSDGAFEREFADYCGTSHVSSVSSGKAALSVILLALKSLSGKMKVIVPAYTCYSVAAAVVNNGFDLIPCDVAGDSFDYDYDKLTTILRRESGVLAVLSVHLFGIPSDTRRTMALCKPRNVFVIEDAAQGLGGMSEDARLGTIGDVGFFSLGRGKNVTCGGGGVIVTNAETVGRAIDSIVKTLPKNGAAHAAKAWLMLLVLSVFMSPRLYWFPAGLPFLRLGETIFPETFAIRRLSNLEKRILRGWRSRLARLDETRRRHSRFYAGVAHGASYDPTVAYLRFPVRISRNARTRLLGDDGRRLGITGMYPTSIARIPQLSGRLEPTEFPEADALAATLVTLPTHPLVTPQDRDAIAALLNQAHATATAEGTPPVGARALHHP